MTFDWQENDIKMAQFMFDKMAPIAKGDEAEIYPSAAQNTPTATLIPPPTRPPHKERWGGDGGRSENQRR